METDRQIEYWAHMLDESEGRPAENDEELRRRLDDLEVFQSDRVGALEFAEDGGTCAYQYNTDRWNGEPHAITADRARALLRDSRWKFGDRAVNNSAHMR